MSIKVLVDSLTPDQVKAVSKHLTLIPKCFIPGGGRGWGKPPIQSQIKFWYIEKGKDGKKWIYLPFFFARVLLRLPKQIPESPERSPNYNILFLGELRGLQVDAMVLAEKQLKDSHTTTLKMFTGIGKTVAGAMLASKHNSRRLIIFDQSICKAQWKSSFKDFTTAKVWIVGDAKENLKEINEWLAISPPISLPPIGAGSSSSVSIPLSIRVDPSSSIGAGSSPPTISIPTVHLPIDKRLPLPPAIHAWYTLMLSSRYISVFKRMLKAGFIAPDADTVICMYKRVVKISEGDKKTFKMLILDECDTLCTIDHVIPLLTSCQPDKIIAETATLSRPDGMHEMIFALCGLHSVDVSLKDKFEYEKKTKGVTRMFKVVKVETGFMPERVRNKMGGTDWGKMVDCILDNIERNAAIMEDVIAAVKAGDKVLILTRRKKDVMAKYNLVKERGDITTDYMCGDKDTYSDSQILIGTPNKLGRAFDEKSACPNFNGKRINHVFLPTTIKEGSAFFQAIGRGFRADDSTITIYVDNDSIPESHWKKNLPSMISAGGEISIKKIMCKPNPTS